MKTVLTYGTFDLFHKGHVRLLKRLSELGDRLIVGISSDEFNELKGKKSFFSFAERKEILEACKYVDLVIAENNWEQKQEDIQKYQVDIFGMGSDWYGKFDHLSDFCQVVYLERTQDISTTEVKKSISMIDDDQLKMMQDSLNTAMEVLTALRGSTQ